MPIDAGIAGSSSTGISNSGRDPGSSSISDEGFKAALDDVKSKAPNKATHQADVQICCRPAQIAGGMVDHCWVRTSTQDKGLGGNPDIRPGDEYESPYATRTYVNDHAGDTPAYCEKMNNVDEQCVNDILDEKTGKPQGLFGFENCQAFAYGVVNKCRIGPQLEPSK